MSFSLFVEMKVKSYAETRYKTQDVEKSSKALVYKMCNFSHHVN